MKKYLLTVCGLLGLSLVLVVMVYVFVNWYLGVPTNNIVSFLTQAESYESEKLLKIVPV
jgi:hypothetical protein